MIKLSKEQIEMLHSNRELKFRYDLLNSSELKIGELECLSGRVGLSSLAQLKRRGDFTFKENELKDVDWLNNRVRPVMILNNKYTFPLGVYMISSPIRSLKQSSVYREVNAFDTSLILHEDKFDKRYVIKENTNYITAIRRIINEAGIYKVDISPSDSLIKTDREFEIGQSRLEIVNILLKEINYTSLWVDEVGTFTSSPYILPSDRVMEYTYRNDEMSIIKPDSVVEEMDIFAVPNKIIVTSSSPESLPLVSTYINDNPGSLTSTINRGRVITEKLEVNEIADQGTLDDYVKRIAYEKSSTYGKFIFDTAIMPHHSYMDALYCEHSDLKISGKYIETSWDMELKAGGKMSHNCRRVVRI